MFKLPKKNTYRFSINGGMDYGINKFLKGKFHNEIITGKLTIPFLMQNLKYSEYKMSDIKQKFANRAIILLIVLENNFIKNMNKCVK